MTSGFGNPGAQVGGVKSKLRKGASLNLLHSKNFTSQDAAAKWLLVTLSGTPEKEWRSSHWNKHSREKEEKKEASSYT